MFINNYSGCHQINGEGLDFGFDLSKIGTKLSKQAIYTSLLYPDQGISFGNEDYLFGMKDGSVAFGMIVSVTEDKVELQYMTTQQTLNLRILLPDLNKKPR